MGNSQPTIQQTGEFGVISQLTRGLIMPPHVSVGPGDDAAVFLVNGSAVTSVDMLVEGVDFRTDWSSASDIGRKTVAMSVADIEAMAALPAVIVIGLAIPADTPMSWAREFLTGVREEAELAHVALVGGDLSQASAIMISSTVIGQTAGCNPVLRCGAQPGDVVAYRGRLGWAGAGLAALSRGFRSPRAAVDAQRHPHVAYGAGRQAGLAGAHAMIDTSDGLLGDLGHIAKASEVVIDLDSARFVVDDPVATVGAALNIDPMEFVLTGGEDHALAACFPPGHVPDDWQVIGFVNECGDNPPCVLVDGKAYDKAQSWTHFGQ